MAAKKKQTEPAPTPAPPAHDPMAEARERAKECHQKIMAVCQKYFCHIQPVLSQPELVGQNGDRMQMSASYGIVPDPIP